MRNTFKARMSEPSTWAGLATVIAAGAQAFATRDPTAIMATLGGLLAIVMPERGRQ